MTRRDFYLTRRAMLAGLVAGAGSAALAEAPLVSERPPARPQRTITGQARPDAERLVTEAKLGGQVAWAVADVATGVILEMREGDLPMPPASTAKTITSLYALDRLGRGFRFSTRLLATGPVVGGKVQGDLILAGGGDPVLSTDDLGDMAAALKANGVTGVTGRFRVWGGALPYLREIDPDQPDWFGYNPSVSGMNLNFNRVNFAWKQGPDGVAVGMDARGERFVPAVYTARMEVIEREGPLFTYSDAGRLEDWTVARAALNREGSRWLPVRRPEAYAGDVFQTLARAQGTDLPDPEVAAALPAGTDQILERRSEPLPILLRDMLKYSTNLTAEAIGMTASAKFGVLDHAGSGAAMTAWLRGQTGATGAHLVDHSGLGPASRISANEMVRALVQLGPAHDLEGLLKDVKFKGEAGVAVPAVVKAKTGTLNFVSALAGYVTTGGGRKLAFAIFTGDTARRDAIPESEREDPPGASAWVKRSKRLQAQLIADWATAFAG